MAKMVHGKGNMTNDPDMFIDSDAFVGWLIEADAHHETTVRTFEYLKAHKIPLITSSAVVAEVATVLSHRVGQQMAKMFLEEFIENTEFPVIFINQSLYQKALNLFKEQSQRGTSFTDCANVIVLQQLGLRTIFSFDQAYPKHFNVQLLQIGQ